MKLINLHHYEKRRHAEVHWATRLANAAMTHGEDHAIRVVSRGDGSVAATWVDFERSDPPPLPCDPDAREFVEKFMQVSESDISTRQKASAAAVPNQMLNMCHLSDFMCKHGVLCSLHPGKHARRSSTSVGVLDLLLLTVHVVCNPVVETCGDLCYQVPQPHVTIVALEFVLRAGWAPKLYLRRNLHVSMRKGAAPAQRISRLKQCYVRNGLECKLKQDDGGNSVRPPSICIYNGRYIDQL